MVDGKVVDVSTLTTLAELSLRADNLDGALQWANKARALDPGHDEALGVVARAAARLGDATRAQKAIKDAATRAPVRCAAGVWMMAGVLCCARGSYAVGRMVPSCGRNWRRPREGTL